MKVSPIKRVGNLFSKNVVLGYLNINSIRNKFDNLQTILNDKMDVLAIAESKIDNSFPTSQFCIKGFKSPFRLDVNDRSGGMLVYVKVGIPTNQLINLGLPQDIQLIVIELRLKKTKWLCIFIYRPPSQDIDYFIR